MDKLLDFRQVNSAISLHGGMDQFDRESTIADFKNGVTNLMIANSVAARGLDVKQLILVVNYDCPNHYEDYVLCIVINDRPKTRRNVEADS